MRKRVLAFMIAAVTVCGCLMTGNVSVKAEDVMIEEDITSLRDSFDENFKTGTLAGVSLTNDEIDNPFIMALVTKHFNAVTLGNELKPDCMFGYSNSKAPELITYDFNGEEFLAPKMDFSRAEKMLNYFADWNAANPDKQIKIRGHVLVWHSQTPEWFFHENFDKKQPYVSVAEMDKRQEWYIKEVLEHFTGKYENMFYGWDVVNEAISDGTGKYRTDSETGESLSNDTHGSNSSWWKVYQSNQYIINAFKFANKYAPDYVELYYNDYNECTPLKTNGIIQLLTDVKNAEGTRIDGMGLQGHYDMSSPTGGQVKVAAKRFSEVVDSVSLTELDLKPSDSFDGTEETLAKELSRQYWKYKEIYQGLKELDEAGVTVRTVTVWGVIDGHSWLQSANNVGGASNGKQKVIPLLFDNEYKAKPLFFALCNEPMPEIKKPEAPAEEVTEDESATEEATVQESQEVTDNVVTEEQSPAISDEPGSLNPAVPIVVILAVIGCGGVVVAKKRKK